MRDPIKEQDSSVFKLVLQEILSRIIKICGCQATGIRLEKNKDFPFYINKNLPDFFLLKENSLLVKDENDHLVYNQNNSELLDCMCGNVILGRFNPVFPFFSKKGSFWTNSTTHLLSTITEEQRKFVGPTRNLCNRSGYESVALIPIKENCKTMGMFYLADPRENMFPIEKIEKLEIVAQKSAAIIKHTNKIAQKLLNIDKNFCKSKD